MLTFNGSYYEIEPEFYANGFLKNFPPMGIVESGHRGWIAVNKQDGSLLGFGMRIALGYVWTSIEPNHNVVEVWLHSKTMFFRGGQPRIPYDEGWGPPEEGFVVKDARGFRFLLETRPKHFFGHPLDIICWFGFHILTRFGLTAKSFVWNEPYDEEADQRYWLLRTY